MSALYGRCRLRAHASPKAKAEPISYRRVGHDWTHVDCGDRFVNALYYDVMCVVWRPYTGLLAPTAYLWWISMKLRMHAAQEEKAGNESGGMLCSLQFEVKYSK